MRSFFGRRHNSNESGGDSNPNPADAQDTPSGTEALDAAMGNGGELPESTAVVVEPEPIDAPEGSNLNTYTPEQESVHGVTLGYLDDIAGMRDRYDKKHGLRRKENGAVEGPRGMSGAQLEETIQSARIEYLYELYGSLRRRGVDTTGFGDDGKAAGAVAQAKRLAGAVSSVSKEEWGPESDTAIPPRTTVEGHLGGYLSGDKEAMKAVEAEGVLHLDTKKGGPFAGYKKDELGRLRYVLAEKVAAAGAKASQAGQTSGAEREIWFSLLADAVREHDRRVERKKPAEENDYKKDLIKMLESIPPREKHLAERGGRVGRALGWYANLGVAERVASGVAITVSAGAAQYFGDWPWGAAALATAAAVSAPLVLNKPRMPAGGAYPEAKKLLEPGQSREMVSSEELLKRAYGRDNERLKKVSRTQGRRRWGAAAVTATAAVAGVFGAAAIFGPRDNAETSPASPGTSEVQSEDEHHHNRDTLDAAVKKVEENPGDPAACAILESARTDVLDAYRAGGNNALGEMGWSDPAQYTLDTMKGDNAAEIYCLPSPSN